MITLTVLSSPPADPKVYEVYRAALRTSLGEKIPEVDRLEVTKGTDG
jgi:hypothetical protein